VAERHYMSQAEVDADEMMPRAAGGPQRPAATRP
jgi:hypothetical protein